jgi:hypothetical protein
MPAYPPKRLYLVVWTYASGHLGKKTYERPSYIAKFIQKLPARNITDVKVFVGELVDVSDQYVPGNFDREAAEAQRRWIDATKVDLDLRSDLFTEGPEIMEWLIAHPRAEPVARVADRIVNRWERRRDNKYGIKLG